jgi:hypothetical protein
MDIIAVRIYLAKHVFQVHAVNAHGHTCIMYKPIQPLDRKLTLAKGVVPI